MESSELFTVTKSGRISKKRVVNLYIPVKRKIRNKNIVLMHDDLDAPWHEQNLRDGQNEVIQHGEDVEMTVEQQREEMRRMRAQIAEQQDELVRLRQQQQLQQQLPPQLLQ